MTKKRESVREVLNVSVDREIMRETLKREMRVCRRREGEDRH